VTASPILELRGVTKRFGGLSANDDVSFQVAEGETVGLIGPNGAGKSTLFEVIAGFYRADGGDIRFAGQSIRGLRPDQISLRGIARTFQKLRPFGDMTVLDNVMVGALVRHGNIGAAREEAVRAIGLVNLEQKTSSRADALSTGQRKRLEVARALATRPRLLLLDEITGGVDATNIPGLVEMIHTLRQEGVTLIVIEHNMRVISSVSERLIALHLGRVLAEGTPQAVAENPVVIQAYLGEAYVHGATHVPA